MARDGNPFEIEDWKGTPFAEAAGFTAARLACRTFLLEDGEDGPFYIKDVRRPGAAVRARLDGGTVVFEAASFSAPIRATSEEKSEEAA